MRSEKRPVLDDQVLAHYASSPRPEDERLRRGTGRIEFLRTQELVRRYLDSERPSRVLDVGGASGVHAEWMAADGHHVHVVDAVPRHVQQAAERGQSPSAPFTASLGDARDLDTADESVDAVLLLGPLYHLVERADRVQALTEARRVLRPAGVVMAAGISRFASLLDGVAHGWLADPDFAAIVAGDLATGVHSNLTGRDEWFTNAYFHRPDELPVEGRDAGLDIEAVLAIEGPGYWAVRSTTGRDGTLTDDDLRPVLETARAVEGEASLLGASPHMLLIARRPA
jgi:ubiquinone/menaquinone biosynthesis C-methylase UbiE